MVSGAANTVQQCHRVLYIKGNVSRKVVPESVMRGWLEHNEQNRCFYNQRFCLFLYSVYHSITLNYEKVEGNYFVDLTLPQDMKAILYVPTNAVVKINGQTYYQNGKYINGDKKGDVEIVEKEIYNS